MDAFGLPAQPLIPPPVNEGVRLDQATTLFRYGENSLYSTQLHVAGAIRGEEFRLFSTGVNQTGQGFTRALSIGETNLRQGGTIPNGVAYDVFGVSCHIMAGSADGDASGMDFDGQGNTIAWIQNLVNIRYNGVLTWDFTQQRVDIAPVGLIGSGGGVFGSLAVVADTQQRVGYIGNGPGTIWQYAAHPVSLPADTVFSVLLRYGSRAEDIAQASVGIKVSLLGFYKNIVEVA